MSPLDLLAEVLTAEAQAALRDLSQVSAAVERVLLQALRTAHEERDEARAHARVLAHAYLHDSRPPRRVVDASLAYPAVAPAPGMTREQLDEIVAHEVGLT